MSSQIVSLAAQFADIGSSADYSVRLTEPSIWTILAVAFAGLLLGRFVINRGHH